MLNIREIEDLVSEGAGERELQAAIKEDLSVIAAGYAIPNNEFIAFSELPIGDGYVDFAIFTSRSRMEIVLIEVKGADFSFSNKDGEIANSILRAAGRIGERFYEVCRSYELFRRKVHEIRHSVESGNQRYNSLLGSKGYLLVDPNKDVYYRGVVIGGRTRDDYHESKRRTQMEMLSASPRISYESWDSWLRKISDARP